VVVIEVRNAGLMETITHEAERLDITDGAIVSLIGAVDSFTISTMPRHDATKDIITNYSLPAEMTGAGEITNGTVHIHAVMAISSLMWTTMVGANRLYEGGNRPWDPSGAFRRRLSRTRP
jgi:uncharacterized protein